MLVYKMLTKKFKKIGFVCLEGLALLLLLTVLAVGVLLWRISSEPIDIGFIKPHIQSAVRDANIGFDIEMQHAYLEWPDFKGPVLIGFGDVNLIGAQDAKILSVDSVGVGLAYGHLLLGNVRPTAIIINKPSLQIVQDNDSISLRLQDTVLDEEDVALDARSPDLTWQQILALRLTEVADQQFSRSTFFSNLDRVEMRGARVMIEDRLYASNKNFDDIDASLLRSDEGASFMVTARLPRDGDLASGFSTRLNYVKSQGQFTFDLSYENVNPFLFGEIFHHAKLFRGQNLAFNGAMHATLDRVLNPIRVDIKTSSDQGEVVLEGEYDAPLTYKDAIAKLSYSAADNRMRVEQLSASINGVDVNVMAQADFKADSIDVPVTLSIEQVTAKAAAELFPKSELKSDGGQWVGEKLREGTYKNIKANVNIQAKRQNVVSDIGPVRAWSWDVAGTNAVFDFENMTIDYSDTLTPATKADGHGEFDGENLTITGTQAFVGDVRGTNLDMKFLNFMVTGGGIANIEMDVEGELASFLKYLSLDPINLGDDLGVSPDDAKGMLKAKLDVSFPTLKDIPKEQVKVAVSGTLTDLYLPDMVEGLALSGGPVSLDVVDGALKVRGKGQIAKRDVDIDWIQYLDSTGKDFAMRVKAKLGADKELRHHFGVDLDDFISGTLPVEIDFIEKQNGNSTIDLKGNVAPMRIDIEPFAYEKPTGVAGDVSMRLHLKKNVLTHIDNLNLVTDDLSVKGARLDFRDLGMGEVELSRATFNGAKIGKTKQDAVLDVTTDNIWKVKARGGVFDAGPFLRDKTPEERAAIASIDPDTNPAFHIDLETDKMLTKKEQSIQKTKLKVNLSREGHVEQMEVDAFAGKGSIYVRYKPNESGQRNFEMKATDAGATLKAFDIFGDVIGGTIQIRGEPVGGKDADDIYGRAELENFRVVNAPALARLINAMSITGLGDALNNGGGIEFEKLDGKFEWDFRPEGSLIKIKDGRTSGSSLGLSFEGSVDRATNMLDIKGTIVPMSGINNVIGSIPLVGDILTGGSGVIAATYTMKGPGTNPKVSINPLSVLTPGFLRRILFEGGSSSGSGDAVIPPMSGNDERTAPSTMPEKTLEPKTTSEDILDFKKPKSGNE